MSDFNQTVTTINNQTAAAMPAVVAAIQAVEALAPEGTTGAQKASAAVAAVTETLIGSSNATVANVAGLVNMAVLIANLLGVFRRKNAARASTGSAPAKL
jgi:hypothetical protein